MSIEHSFAFSFTSAINCHNSSHSSLLTTLIFSYSDALPTPLLMSSFHVTGNILFFLHQLCILSSETFTYHTFLSVIVQFKMCGFPPYLMLFCIVQLCSLSLADSSNPPLISKQFSKDFRNNIFYPTFSTSIIPMSAGCCLFVTFVGRNFILRRGYNFEISILYVIQLSIIITELISPFFFRCAG